MPLLAGVAAAAAAVTPVGVEWIAEMVVDATGITVIVIVTTGTGTVIAVGMSGAVVEAEMVGASAAAGTMTGIATMIADAAMIGGDFL